MLDVVQRYAPIVNAIRKDLPKDKRIVEIGGEGEGLAHYLPDFEIIDCDIKFAKNPLSNVKPVKVKGVKLPLPDNHADIVVSVDMLEHLSSRKKQARMVKEMLRVAKQKVFLGVPTGKESLKAVKSFGQMFGKKYPKKDYKYLNEHLAYGHPEKEEIIKMIKKSGFKTSLQTEKNSNIKLWLLFQRIYLKFPKLYFFFRYRRFWYYFLKPVFPFLNFGETMRTIFYVSLAKNSSL